MSNEEKWSLIWNHDVQFGFVCGAFAGVFGLVLMFFAIDLFARIVTGSKRQPQRQPVRGHIVGRLGQPCAAATGSDAASTRPD